MQVKKSFSRSGNPAGKNARPEISDTRNKAGNSEASRIAFFF